MQKEYFNKDLWKNWHKEKAVEYHNDSMEADRKYIFEYILAVVENYSIKNKIERVIEFGVGNAYLLSKISRIVPANLLYGIDINESVMSHNKKMFSDINFICEDANAVLPKLKTQKFTMVYSIATLSYFSEEEIEHCFRLIKKCFPNGIFIFSGLIEKEYQFTEKNLASTLMQNKSYQKYNHNYEKFIIQNNYEVLDYETISLAAYKIVLFQVRTSA